MIAEFYKPGKSALHHLDPRVKLVLLVVVLAAFFIPSAPWVLLLFTGAIVCVISVFLGLVQLVPPLKTLWPILILIFFLTPPFHRAGAAAGERFRVRPADLRRPADDAPDAPAVPGNHIRFLCRCSNAGTG